MFQYNPQRTGLQANAITNNKYKVQWSKIISRDELTGSETTPVFFDDIVLVGAHNGLLIALNRNTGDVKWSFKTEYKLYSTPLVIQNKIFLISGSGVFHVLSKNGIELFSTIISDCKIRKASMFLILENVIRKKMGLQTKKHSIGTIRNWASLNYGNDCIYAVVAGRGLISFDTNGALNWQHELGNKNDYHLAGVAIDNHGNIYVPSFKSQLFCIDKNGNEVWKKSTGINSIHWSNPSIDVNNSKIFIGTEYNQIKGSVVAFDFKGNRLWKSYLGQAVRGSVLIGLDKFIYASGLSGTLYKLCAETGKIEATYNLSKDIRGLWTSPTMDKLGNLLVSVKLNRKSGGIIKINKAGVVKWLYKGPKILATPSISDDGKVYFGAWDNTIKCLIDQND